MSSSSQGSGPPDGRGSEFLTRRSDVNKSRQAAEPLSDVLVVDDETKDASRLAATVRLAFGYATGVRTVATLSSAVDAVLARLPDLILLDDHLDLSADRATDAIPFLRRAGYAGPIIVVSGLVTRKRTAELVAAGADGILHKDDVNATAIAEALTATATARNGRQG
ncbi:MAG: response regulator [Hyphomicrobiaceae bacterium]|nr:response regulator [Hyphomicrobiaceae bacterium]